MRSQLEKYLLTSRSNSSSLTLFHIYFVISRQIIISTVFNSLCVLLVSSLFLRGVYPYWPYCSFIFSISFELSGVCSSIHWRWHVHGYPKTCYLLSAFPLTMYVVFVGTFCHYTDVVNVADYFSLHFSQLVPFLFFQFL